jgi:putative spermidine/putrescine transport system substrate-binding protein
MAVSDISRRTVLKGLAFGAVLGTVAACGSKGDSGSSSPGKLNITYDGGAFGDSHDKVVSQPFTKKTNISVSTVTTTEDNTLAKLLASKGNFVFDCPKFGSNKVGRAASLGLLQKLDPSVVTGLGDVADVFKSDYWAPSIVATLGIAYRSDKVPNGISSWWDLWDPKLAGKVGLPVFSWVGNTWMMIVNSLLKGDPANPTAAADKLSEYMKLNPVQVQNSDVAGQLLTSGEVWALPYYDGRTSGLKSNGVEVKFVYPTEGALPIGSGMSVSVDAANPKGAQQYVAFDIAPEQQIAMAVATHYSPASPKVLKNPPDSIKDYALAPEVLDNAVRIDFLTANDHLDTYQKLWNEKVLTS